MERPDIKLLDNHTTFNSFKVSRKMKRIMMHYREHSKNISRQR
jgi:hypothetical protein